MIDWARGETETSTLQRRLLVMAMLCLSIVACGGGSTSSAGPDRVAEQGSMIVYGNDDRREYFEVDEPSVERLFRANSVALMNAKSAVEIFANPLESLPTWEQTEGLCSDEPFASQPAAAFCSGVLMADDLVVTAEHCLDFASAESVRIVLGYYYLEPGVLSAQPSDVYRVESILLRASDLGENELDFAWLRLGSSANPAHEPSLSFEPDPHLAIGDNLITVSAGGGVPLKVDARVRVAGFEEGRFVAEADMFRGSSGGGAFTPDGELVGLFVRGLSDFEPSEAGCMTTRRHASAGAGEQFTYAYRAVEAFCDVEPTHSLCQMLSGTRNSRDAPAMNPPREPSCALTVPHRVTPAGSSAALLALALAFFARHLCCRLVRRQTQTESGKPCRTDLH